ncbi:MAG: zinc ribbon domain-containing protein [Elusimicrobia bacterium]|nr:zinc ribbon domain-containing protein [Elusimicrobiota bacterium]
MADAHPIVCSKCKKPGSADRAECASCGGRVVRVCGSCGFKNSAAKKYCDVCGENFTVPKAAGAPPPPPKPEAKAPPPPPRPAPKPPPPAPRPEAKAPPPPPKPAPRPEPKPEPRPEPKPAPRPEPRAEPKPEPRPEPKPEPRPEAKSEPAPLELKPRDAAPAEPPPPPKEEPPSKASKDEAMERFLPKTVISRLPKDDVPRVERDDEPVPDMHPPEKRRPPIEEERPPERPEPPPAKPAGGPPVKKERVKMRLEGDKTPLPRAKEPSKDPLAGAPREPLKEKRHGEIDPRLIKGYERHEHHRDRSPAAAARRPEPSFTRTFIRERPKAVFSTLLALFLLATGGVVYFIKVRQSRSPAETLVKSAGDYLFALKQKDYAGAYAMLTAASKQAAPEDSFRKLQDDSVWTFDDLQARMVSPGWAVVRYKLLVSGQPYDEDWLVLRYEAGAWRRAYWWPLQAGIESALGRGDHDAALRLAGQAQSIDPLDPMPVEYACEADYMAGDSAGAEDACTRAIKMTDTLPSRVGNEGLFRMRYILADIDRNVLKRPDDAVRRYGILLQYPKIDAAQRCDVSLARAETELQQAQAPAALADFQTAQSACALPADSAYAARAARILSGAAGDMAVAAVQAYRMPGQDQSLAEWRSRTRADVARRLGTRVSRLPPDAWAPAYKGGSVYDVALKSGQDSVLDAEVDLLSGQIKVEMHVQ